MRLVVALGVVLSILFELWAFLFAVMVYISLYPRMGCMCGPLYGLARLSRKLKDGELKTMMSPCRFCCRLESNLF
jgi:hypothetical protein